MICSFDLPFTERVVYELKEFFKAPIERTGLIYSYYIKRNFPWEKRKANKAHMRFMLSDIIEKIEVAYTSKVVVGYQTTYGFDGDYIIYVYKYENFYQGKNGIFILSIVTGKAYEMYLDDEGVEMKTKDGEHIDVNWVRSIRKGLRTVYDISVF